jgi:hypothetical protein
MANLKEEIQGNLQDTLTKQGQAAKEAARFLAIASTDLKNKALLHMADKLEERKAEIIKSNLRDMEQAVTAGISSALLDRLALNEDRIKIMERFIRYISKPLLSLSFDNLPVIAELGLLSEDQMNYEYRIYKFRKYLYSKKFFVKQDGKSDSTAYYKLDRKFAEPFFYNNFETNMIESKDYYYDDEGYIVIKKGSLEREIKKIFLPIKETVLEDSKVLKAVNEKRYQHHILCLWHRTFLVFLCKLSQISSQ